MGTKAGVAHLTCEKGPSLLIFFHCLSFTYHMQVSLLNSLSSVSLNSISQIHSAS